MLCLLGGGDPGFFLLAFLVLFFRRREVAALFDGVEYAIDTLSSSSLLSQPGAMPRRAGSPSLLLLYQH